MIQFSRVYSNEPKEQTRLEVFKKNLAFIQNLNAKANQSYKLGVNRFTDRTNEEFLATRGGPTEGLVVGRSRRLQRWKTHNLTKRKMGLASPRPKPPCRSKVSNTFNATTSVHCLRLYRSSPSRCALPGWLTVSSITQAECASDCGITVTHAVTIVGYGRAMTGSSIDWLRTLGRDLGRGIHIRLRRDVEWPEGMCGLAQYGRYPVA
ncbi:hypothetical protein DY000_02047312 [Brassica cretica]|uniref:Cathepsin propeptide inhibitor domain-containing protein n=1 Tax=Brassica cretica TaxID=69181 RepID=A0ABQ7F2P0_BRACR|nr:hypothetical protein DY000_02047312 [Brassica cretica]